MKHIGSGMIAVLFLLQACGDDRPKASQPKSPDAKPVIAPTPAAPVQEATPTDPNAPLSRVHAVRFYNALLATASGQDTLNGECGNISKHFKRANKKRKTVNVHMPFKNCEVDKLTIEGDLHLSGARNAKASQHAVVAGSLQVTGELTGTCAVNLTYPTDAVFEMLNSVSEDNTDLGVLDPAQLGGTLCDVAITELIQEADSAKPQAKRPRFEAPLFPEGSADPEAAAKLEAAMAAKAVEKSK